MLQKGFRWCGPSRIKKSFPTSSLGTYCSRILHGHVSPPVVKAWTGTAVANVGDKRWMFNCLTIHIYIYIIYQSLKTLVCQPYMLEFDQNCWIPTTCPTIQSTRVLKVRRVKRQFSPLLFQVHDLRRFHLHWTPKTQAVHSPRDVTTVTGVVVAGGRAIFGQVHLDGLHGHPSVFTWLFSVEQFLMLLLGAWWRDQWEQGDKGSDIEKSQDVTSNLWGLMIETQPLIFDGAFNPMPVVVLSSSDSAPRSPRARAKSLASLFCWKQSFTEFRSQKKTENNGINHLIYIYISPSCDCVLKGPASNKKITAKSM